MFCVKKRSTFVLELFNLKIYYRTNPEIEKQHLEDEDYQIFCWHFLDS